MDNIEFLNIILTSTLIAGITSAIVSFLTSLHLRKVDYRNDYYKEIIKKRMDAYEYIDAQIAILKPVVLDDNDGRAYHIIFSYGEDEFLNFQKNLFVAVSYSMWIDKHTTGELENLNGLFYSLNNKIHLKTNSEAIEIGKEYYEKISDSRFRLEQATKKGLYNLHDVKKVFKSEKKNRKRYIYK